MSMVNTHSESGDFEVAEDLCLPEGLREELSRQYQPVITSAEIHSSAEKEKAEIVAVGDMVCRTLIEDNVIPKITLFDFKTQRTEIPESWVHTLLSTAGARLRIRNPPGILSKELWEALKLAWEFPGNTKIIVDGEEDLAGLASIYLMKGALIVYGLPGKGMTAIRSDDASRDVALSVLKRLIPASRLKSVRGGASSLPP